ncbi:hypothetical protein RG963_14395 [Methanosarcina sp. Z-7115]|uniref:Uncharacterized protein n=1 Tax=Methanosarcina baikalica TaxID=3073890 RepID=A0ABU2D4S0_9EURY|nr:hypothetical protein [Methanosarcina sp. Z-7115]MDR7666948.1 hypothetical protein [Methanosarcina sp. Z-7115]
MAIIKETELFKVVNVPIQDTVEKFVQLATVTAENQKEHFTGNMDAIVNISSFFRQLLSI